MRIALLTNGIFPYVVGGMQKHSFYLCKHLAQSGIDVDLYHTSQQNQYDIGQLELFTDEERQNIHSTVIDFPNPGRLPGHYLRASHLYSERIWDAFRMRPPVDFIYSKGLTGWKFIEEKRKGANLPPIGNKSHGYEMFQRPPSLKLRLQNRLLQPAFRYNALNSDHIFSYGGKITEILTQQIGVARTRIIEIPTGIDSSWITPHTTPPNFPRKFVFIGRAERRKGIEELTKVLAEISSKVDFQFDFIGPTPRNKRIISPNINYHGTQTKTEFIQKTLRSADVLVCPSYSEGMPNVILEGMASGCTIIATDVGAIRQMVSPDNGWLIPPANSQALRDAIQSSIDTPTHALLRMKQRSIEAVSSKFRWDRIARQTIANINDITNS